ncbi:MAG TPA: ComEC/Rec2 family competence protein, partial [Acidimicrobiia bacterium]
MEQRTFRGQVTLLTDTFDGSYGQWAIGRLADGVVLVDLEGGTGLSRGDVAEVSGEIRGSPGTAAGRPYGAVLDVQRVQEVIPSRFLPHRAGSALRRRVEEALQPYDAGRGLLAGFLIGDTSHVSEIDVEAMRRSGLSHFVAVSGSNVALFLGLLAVVAGPFSMGPRRRAILALASLPVYVAATRFEPSVIRAAVMAGIALGGRLFGVVLEAWQLLSLAVAALVVLDPGLTSNVGFQLSVVATAGVLVGARWPLRGVVRRALAVTIGAQMAVAPLLLLHFGSVPLLSPLVNLIAAPLVTASTLIGAIGVGGLGFLVDPAGWLASVVLELARAASGWPQLGPVALSGILVATATLAVMPRLRTHAVVPAAVVIALSMVTPNATIPAGAVAVLDVGQGDAILLSGGEGRFALVDGGPDAARLVSTLRDYGVTSLELVVLTHVHADHATGLSGLVGAVGIGAVWADTDPHHSGASDRLFEAMDRHGVSASIPSVGQRWHLGGLELVVEGPLRRYASPNDQSIVLSVRGSRRSMLLAGDIEMFAQSDLSHLRADVLKVPHQGAATSDPDWLTGVGADLAVISVGPNQFGHPADWVVETLRMSGADVLRTDLEGDIVVDLGSS